MNIDKKKIIKDALTKIKPNLLLTEELIYELRYDKVSLIGINALSNRALHIVTKDKRYKTQDRSLNFVFFEDADIKKCWAHYYYFVSYLLIYAAAIIDSLVFRYLPDNYNQNLKTVKLFRRFIGLLLWTERINNQKSNKVIFDSLKQTIKIDCLKCKTKAKLSRRDYEAFFESGDLLCPNCLQDLFITSDSIRPIKKYMENMP